MAEQDNSVTLDYILKLYSDDGWDYKEYKDPEEFKGVIKPSLTESYGGSKPIFNKGLLVNIDVSSDAEKSNLLFAYTSRTVESLLTDSKANLHTAIENSVINYDEFPKKVEDIDKMIVESQEKYNDSICVIGKVFVIENTLLKTKVDFTFLFDNDKTVPFDSIIVRDSNEVIVLLSQQFRDKFEDVKQAEHLTSIILSAISYILEQFK